MSDPSAAVQKAVYAALAASGAITRGGSDVPVYDHVPEGTAKPYVVLESMISAAADYLSNRKDDRLLYLSVWSTYRGQAEVLDIMEQIDAALADARLTLETGALIRCQVAQKRTVRDIDMVTFQGQVTLRLMTAH